MPVIGYGKDGIGSLADLDIRYKEIRLTTDGNIDWDLFKDHLSNQTALIAIQRSRGYADRPSFKINQVKKIIETVKKIAPNIPVFVDNCYGEFVETMEPTHVGADLIAGSLIKNPGGGLAKSGGYVVGKSRICLKNSF